MFDKLKQIPSDNPNNHGKIPTTGNIIEIVTSVVQSLNTLVDIIDNSSFKNPSKAVKKIEKTSNAVFKSIKHLSVIVGLIQNELLAAEVLSSAKKSTASILSNPIEFIKSIKEKKPYESKEPNLIQYFYNITSLLAQISDLHVDPKHIKKLIKNIKSVLSSVININNYVNKKAVKYKTLNQVAVLFLKSIPGIWDLLIKALNNVQSFYDKCQKLNPKVLKKQIKNIIKIYSYLISGCVALVMQIEGRKMLGKMFGIKSSLSARYGDIIKGLTVMVVISTLFCNLLPVMTKFLEGLNNIAGLNWKHIKKVIKNTFGACGYLIKGCQYLSGMATIKNAVNIVKTAAVIVMLIALANLMLPLAIKLDKIGEHTKGIKKGIKAFRLILGGKQKRLFHTQQSLVSTIMDIEIPEELRKKTIKLIITTGLLLVLTTTVFVITVELSKMGKMLITTMLGLWLMEHIIHHIIGILTDKENETTKTAKEKAKELIVVVGWFTVLVSFTLTFFIISSTLVGYGVMALVGLWFMKHIIRRIIGILTDKKHETTETTKGKAKELIVVVGLFVVLALIMTPLSLIGFIGGLSIYLAVVFIGYAIKSLVKVFEFLNKKKNQNALASASKNLGLLKADNVILLSIITDTIQSLSKVYTEIKKATIAMAVGIVLIFAILFTIKILGGKRVKKIITSAETSVVKFGVLATTIIGLLNSVISTTEKLKIKRTLYVIPLLYVIITSLVALCWVVGRKWVKKLLASTEVSVLLLTTTIGGFEKLIGEMGKLTSKTDFNNMIYAVTYLSISILILLGFFIVVGLVAKQAAKQVTKSIFVIGLMTLCIGNMLIISYALMLMSKMPVDPKNIGCILLSIVMLTGTMVIFGLVSGGLLLPALGVSAMMLLIAIALIDICAALTVLAKFDINTLEKAKENAAKVFEVTGEIIRSFMHASVLPESRSDNKFLRVIQYIGGGIAQVVEAFLCMSTILFMMVAIVAIVIIAAMLEMLQDIKLNSEKIKENIQKIFDTVNQIIQFLVDPESDINKNEPEDNGVIGTLLGWFSPNLVSIWNVICVFDFLVITVMVVGAVLAVGNMLEHIQKMKINTADITAVVNDLFSCVKLLNDKLAGNETVDGAPEAKEEGGGFWKTVGDIFGDIIEGAADFFKRIGGYISVVRALIVVGALYFLGKSLNFIQTVDINKDAIKAKVDTIFDTYNSVCDKIKDEKLTKIDAKSFANKTKQLNTFIDSIQNFADATNDINAANVKPFIDVIDKACSIDVDSVRTVANLFKQMATFSMSINGNIKMLADTLSGDLLDAIKELNDCLGQSKDVVVENNVNSSDIGKTEGEVIKEQNKETKEDVKTNADLSEVTDRMDQIKTSLKQLQIALDDIKSGYNGFSFR